MLLLVSEMMCNHCTSSVEKALRGVATVTDVSVDLDSKLARVTGAATASEYLAAVSEAGHPEAELVPETVLRVEGMMCGHCTATVDRALREVAEVMEVKVDLESKLATVHGKAPSSKLIDACVTAGKTAELVSSSTAASDAPTEVVEMFTDSMPNPTRLPKPLEGSVALPDRLQKYDTPLKVRVRQPDAPFDTGSPSDSPMMKRMQFMGGAVSRALLGQSEETLLLSIRGMTCAACVGAVERALVAVPGVKEVSVSLMGKRGQVFYSPDLLQGGPPALVHAVNDAGFEAEQLNPSDEVNPKNNFEVAEEVAYYKGQFLGSLPLALGAVLVAKILPSTRPGARQGLLEARSRAWSLYTSRHRLSPRNARSVLLWPTILQEGMVRAQERLGKHGRPRRVRHNGRVCLLALLHRTVCPHRRQGRPRQCVF